MDFDRLLAEVEDVLRTMPARATIFHDAPENLAWFGRAKAVVIEHGPSSAQNAERLMQAMHEYTHALKRASALNEFVALLHQVRHQLRMKAGLTSIVVGKGDVFDYFDGLRKVVQGAQSDVFFVDPYLDADFVSTYLPHVKAGVMIRLLAREKLGTLLPAVDKFAQQAGTAVQVRSIAGFHDRYVFVDRGTCYQSGASFKDGARTAPTTLTQITDAFKAMWQTYDELWTTARVER